MGSGNGNTASEFGFWVRSYRREAGLTQRELAAKAGLSVGALRDVEQSRRTRPRATSLAALASALELGPAQTAKLALAAALPPRRRHALPLSRQQPDDSDFTPTARLSARGRGLWLAALGPLEAWRDGMPLYLGPPARRVVLGLLLMEPGAFVRRDTIIDALWGESPPSTAVALVQAHVSRIRKLLNARDRGGGNDAVIDSAGGAYPTAELAEAYAGVLRQDFRASSQARPPASARALPDPAAVIPRQLPAAQPRFTGRRGELAALSALVEREPTAASSVTITALTGMAGIGKTALAVHCAHQFADRFPDGQLFVNLQGSGACDGPVHPTDAVRDFLAALGVPAAEIPIDTDRQAALYRSLVADRRMLIVLDDALNTLPAAIRCTTCYAPTRPRRRSPTRVNTIEETLFIARLTTICALP